MRMNNKINEVEVEVEVEEIIELESRIEHSSWYGEIGCTTPF
jgi:hypothetical protein